MKKLISGVLIVFAVNLAYAMQTDGSPDNPDTAITIDSVLKQVELIPIMINGDKDNRINIVIMNRWTSDEVAPYNSEDMREEFIKDINESLIAALTPGDERAQTAFANYREFFNVYGLWYPETPEWNKGIDTKTVDALRDSLFLPWKNEHTGWVTFLVMPNLDKGGGGAARNLEARVGRALIAGKGIGKMLHEIAHTCMSIGDEYTGAATDMTAVPTYNNAKKYRREELKWKKWIDPDTPLPTPYEARYKDKVGAFEGTQYHLTGFYRSSAQGCIMGAGIFDNTEKMCAICEQRVAMRVNKLVNPINSFSPAEPTIEIKGKTKLHFAVDHIRPIPNTQLVKWVLNGKTIATDVDEIDIQLGMIGEYELTCILIDETPFIRPDPPYGQYPKREIRWKIRNTSPTSKAKKITLELEASSENGVYMLKPIISGGKPPYTYAWSTGSTAERLEEVEVGIYELVVTDREYRSVKAHYVLTEGKASSNKAAIQAKTVKTASKPISLEVNLKATDMDQENGKIMVAASGGTKPYHYSWKDFRYEYARTQIYEAEDAQIDIPGHTKESYFDAGNNQYIQFNEHEGSLTWSVEVARSGYYPLEIIYGGLATKGLPMELIINGQVAEEPLLFHPSRPLFTGWEKAGGSFYLKEGQNQVSLHSQGKSGPNIDYLRVPTSYTPNSITASERMNLQPGAYTVVVSDGEDNTHEQTIVVPEVYPFQVKNLEFVSLKPGSLSIVNPLHGYTYHWYAQDVSPFVAEKFKKPLHTGTEFTPPAPGNYFVSAKNELTQGESSNRICFAVDDVSNAIDAESLDPAALDNVNIKLWFDADDLDGDRREDLVAPPRGPLREWKEKTRRDPGKIFTKYEPNRLNGKGVCAFDNVWVSDLGKKVSDIRTVILVYKESDMTQAGASPFRELNHYLGTSSDPRQRIFDPETIADQTRNGKVYLNGRLVDPFNTPNPMDYCILTVEFASAITDTFSRFEGLWEGEIAEMIFLDGLLSDSERKGIEAYLHKKWLAGVLTRF